MKTLQSIRTKQEFQAIFDHGLIFKGKLLKVWLDRRKGGAEKSSALRLAIIVSGKTAAKATDRNTWRRRIREIVRKKLAAKLESAALVIVVRKTGCVSSSREIEMELEKILHEAARAEG